MIMVQYSVYSTDGGRAVALSQLADGTIGHYGYYADVAAAWRAMPATWTPQPTPVRDIRSARELGHRAFDAYRPVIMAEDTRRTGGGTFGADGRPAELVDGYMVGGASAPIIVDATDLARNIGAAAEILARVDGNTFIGSWVDGGRIYWELSDHVTDRAAALELANRRGELAIWDVAASAEIRVS